MIGLLGTALGTKLVLSCRLVANIGTVSSRSLMGNRKVASGFLAADTVCYQMCKLLDLGSGIGVGTGNVHVDTFAH